MNGDLLTLYDEFEADILRTQDAIRSAADAFEIQCHCDDFKARVRARAHDDWAEEQAVRAMVVNYAGRELTLRGL